MCGATKGGLSLDGIDVAKEAVIQGRIVRGTGDSAEPVPNAYVRLLDRTGEFTAEVPTSATGHFRFFAGDGEWTLRTLAPQADPVDRVVQAKVGSVAEVQIFAVTGFVVLAVAVVAAAGLGIWRLRTDGRFSPVVEERLEERGALATSLETAGADLGDRATLLQFSSAFCAPCRATRVVLADVAAREPGVSHVDLDAEAHLDLVRALDVRRTPTTLVLDAAGRELVRAAGAPRREQVLAALPGSVVDVRAGGPRNHRSAS